MNIEEYARKHRHFWNNAKVPAELKFLVDNNSFDALIDIGCGDGALLHKLKTLGYLEKINVWAVDSSETRLESVKKISDDIKTVQDDAQMLSKVPDSFFDLIVTTQVIEHVFSDEDMVRSFSRIAKRGAVVYLDTVFKKTYGIYFYRNKFGRFVLDPTHEREYRSEEHLFEVARANGFKIIYSGKEHIRLSILNFFLRKLGLSSEMGSKILSTLAAVKVPIPGYFCWKILMVKD